MADSRYPLGQDEQHIFHPQLPPQVNPIQPGGQGSSTQGPPKMSGMPPPPMPGPPYQGVAPAPHMMPAGAAPSQAPLPPFSNPPSGAAGLPPPAGANSVNGYVPPGPQGPLPQGPAGVFRPPGPPQPSGGGPFPPAGSVGPVPGQNVPHSSYSGHFPPSGVGQTVNGKNTPPLVPSTQQPMIRGQPPSRFPQPGPVGGPPRLPVFSSQPPAGGGPAPPRMLAPPPGTGSAPSPVPSNATPGSGLLSPPTELPIPFHGQAQYSHQVGATMKITPNPTPNNSEPPSQRSSRDPSPVNEQTFDAMEGQFSPSQGASSPRPGSRGSNRGSPFPGPGAPGSQSPFLPGQGKGTPPPSGQSMTPPPRPGMGGSPGVGGAPPPGSSVGTRPPGPPALGQPRPGYNPMAPYPGSGFQPGAPPRPPGPPTGVQGYPPGPASGPGPYHQGPPGPPGQGSGLQGPPPPGPQPGPFNLGHPTSGQGSGPPSAPYSLGPPRPGQGPPHAGPPSGPFQGPPTGPLQGPPTGPLQGPPSGPPSGPFQPGPAAGASSGPVNMGRPVPGGQAGGFYQPPPPTSQGMMAGPPFGPPSGPTGPMGPPAGPTGPLSGHTGPPSGLTGPPSGLTGGASGPRGPYSQPGPGQGYPQPGPGQGYPQPGPGQGYPQPGPGQGYPQPAMGAVNNMAGDFNKMGVNDSQGTINLMQEKRLIPPDGLETARPSLYHDHKRVNCNPDVFRCTINAIPQTSSLLNKSRLPLGILIHPFKDLSAEEESQLPVIQSSVIVRCRSCRSYINPFVTFVDQRRWKCNLCFRVNDLPDEFSFDPVTKSYGDPQRRPEIRSATIEFIAPSEYMLRPPQPAVYLFVLDVSFNAIETGYLRMFTQTLIEELDRIPGDARAQIGFICFDRSLYFFNLSEGLSQPQMMVMPDLEDVFLPCPDSLMVNMHERRDMVMELLNQLPTLFEGNQETGNALGSALQAAFKLLTSTGGRVTVVQTTLPTVGPGSLGNREAASKNASLNVSNLGPASDFYKKLALDCSAQQVAVDLFMLNGQYADLASVSCISKYSAGCVQYYPAFHTLRNPAMTDKLESDLRRYLTRKIGFEAVMRIRCTRGISIHTFHGNFFVRSTDLLSLPNVNPDAGFGMQMSIEENLTESSNICFQAALLYTSSKGERRIRVHSLCVPVTNQLSDVFGAADQQAIASLLAKMAVDRTISSSLEDARDAMMNACQDMMNAYATQIPAGQRAGALMAPFSMRLIPLFTQAMLKSVAFRLSANIRVDERVFAHLLAKCLPSAHLLQTFYPHLYPVHGLNDQEVVENNKENSPKAPRLQLSSANVDRHGVYVMDQGESMYLMVGGAVPDSFCQSVFNAPNFTAIPEGLTDLPELENPTSERLRSFIGRLMDSRPGGVSFLVLREDSKARHLFFQYMVEDRTENSKSYYEFLQFIQQKVKG